MRTRMGRRRICRPPAACGGGRGRAGVCRDRRPTAGQRRRRRQSRRRPCGPAALPAIFRVVFPSLRDAPVDGESLRRYTQGKHRQSTQRDTQAIYYDSETQRVQFHGEMRRYCITKEGDAESVPTERRTEITTEEASASLSRAGGGAAPSPLSEPQPRGAGAVGGPEARPARCQPSVPSAATANTGRRPGTELRLLVFRPVPPVVVEGIVAARRPPAAAAPGPPPRRGTNGRPPPSGRRAPRRPAARAAGGGRFRAARWGLSSGGIKRPIVS